MLPGPILRVEGVAVFLASTGAYYVADGPLWLFFVLALAPDISMVAYLAGNRVGSSIYNVFHSYALALAVGGFGLWFANSVVTWTALVWVAHIGGDRAVGYGLKYPDGFSDTHLGRVRAERIEETATRDGVEIP